MNTISSIIKTVNPYEREIYLDMMRKFRKDGHEVYIICPYERREGNE